MDTICGNPLQPVPILDRGKLDLISNIRRSMANIRNPLRRGDAIWQDAPKE